VVRFFFVCTPEHTGGALVALGCSYSRLLSNGPEAAIKSKHGFSSVHVRKLANEQQSHHLNPCGRSAPED
jgi:hypothetical protein